MDRNDIPIDQIVAARNETNRSWPTAAQGRNQSELHRFSREGAKEKLRPGTKTRLRQENLRQIYFIGSNRQDDQGGSDDAKMELPGSLSDAR